MMDHLLGIISGDRFAGSISCPATTDGIRCQLLKTAEVHALIRAFDSGVFTKAHIDHLMEVAIESQLSTESSKYNIALAAIMVALEKSIVTYADDVLNDFATLTFQ